LRLRQAAQAPVERLYWYSLIDLDPRRPCIEMTEDGRCDENEYHMGLVTHQGQRKPAFYELQRLLAEEAEEAEPALKPHRDSRGASASARRYS